MRALVILVLLSAACTSRNPAFCESDEDCAGTTTPFCDIDGEFPDSNGTRNTCTPTPVDCPLERCGCNPGDPLSCDLDQLTVCATDGKSTTTSTCALGCATEDRCLAFEPSNGLGPALEMAIGGPDVVIPDGARIDTELGLIQDVESNLITVQSILVDQPDGTKIRAFIAGSFVLDRVVARGRHSLAIVAARSIALRGRLDASADNQTVPGPGAHDLPDSCFGAGSRADPPMTFFFLGGGGGGNATSGGVGGGFGNPGAGEAGGTAITSSNLLGGCGASVSGIGGAGGGAVQLVSLEEITLQTAGLIDVGGGGGLSSEGGGSGGLVVLEAPRVRVAGAATGITANGGAGGGCGSAGSDATTTTSVTMAPRCTGASAGDGGTGFFGPGSGDVSSGGSQAKGGGGGAAGRARITTKDGAMLLEGNPVVSAHVTELVLAPK